MIIKLLILSFIILLSAFYWLKTQTDLSYPSNCSKFSWQYRLVSFIIWTRTPRTARSKCCWSWSGPGRTGFGPRIPNLITQSHKHNHRITIELMTSSKIHSNVRPTPVLALSSVLWRFSLNQLQIMWLKLSMKGSITSHNWHQIRYSLVHQTLLEDRQHHYTAEVIIKTILKSTFLTG